MKIRSFQDSSLENIGNVRIHFWTKIEGVNIGWMGMLHCHIPVKFKSKSEDVHLQTKQLVSKVGRSDAPTYTIEETPWKSKCQVVVQDFNKPAQKSMGPEGSPTGIERGNLKSCVYIYTVYIHMQFIMFLVVWSCYASLCNSPAWIKFPM